jgi:hypothetical protein
MINKIHPSSFALVFLLWLVPGAWQSAAATTRDVGVGQTHLTIADALAAAVDDDVINIVDATHTACDVHINKNVTIQGQGADVTIIQGAASPQTACGPVFIIGFGKSVTIKKLTIRYGNAAGAYPDDRGGGIHNDYGTLTIQDCVLTENYADTFGGGICCYGNMSMTRCTLSNNTAVRSGGGLEIADSNGDRTITITNSTFSGNTATRADAVGGGINFLIYPYIVGVTLTNCTIAGNTVADGVSGNGMYLDNAGTFTLNITNCVLSNGTAGNFTAGGAAPTINRSYTLVRDGTMSAYAGTGNLDSTDPSLESLGDYGGELTTHALGLGSPCVDAGTSTGAPSTDERGTVRPKGAAYDMGAFEAVVPSVTTIAASNITAATAQAGGTVTCSSGTLVARGVCWNTSADPTILDSHTSDFLVVGTQSSPMTGLSPSTLYHFRAYGMSAEGVSYGADMTFTTAGLPSVTTTAISSITGTTAASGGTIAAYAVKPITARGVCWNAVANPTIAEAHTTDGTGVGSFASSLAGLIQGTTYYVRAYATTLEGTSYGNEVSFTPAVLPTLSTVAVSSVTVTTAQSGGNISSDGGATVTARGVCWNTSTTPTTANSHTTDGTGTGGFTSALTSLTQGTLYYVRAYAINTVGTAYGDEVTFTTNDVPTVSTAAVSYVNPTAAVTGGDVTCDGGNSVTARGVCWGTTVNPTTADSHTQDGTGTGVFVSSITGLAPNTTYHVRAYASNTLGTGYGSDIPFVTTVTTASVILTGVSDITASTATWGGSVTADGGSAVTARGTCWSTSADPTTGDSYTTDGTGVGTFSSSLTGLTFNTTYHVRAYATNGQGTAYSDDVTFVCAPTTPTLTTRAASNISATTADSGGDISATGGAAVAACGVCWNTTGTPTVYDSNASGTVGAGFTAALTGLSPGVLYYIRAYATNSAGTAYGNQASFTTLTLVPTVTTASVSNIGSTTADCGGSVGSDGGAAVSARGVCWSTSANPTTADSHTTNGTGTGTFASSITGLTAGTTYHVRAYATNSQGTGYGADLSFTSSTTVPTLTTRAASAIAATTATGGGDISSNGGSAVTACGVCWNTSGSPTLDDGHAGGTVGAGFTASLTGLAPGILYHVRAYAINAVGVAYGEEVTFTTLATLPTVTTAAVSNITVTSADCGGTVTDDGSDAVTARGVCWGTGANPTIAGSHTHDGTGTGTFTSSITGLTAYTTYYVRAYATNSQGTAYGAEVTFISSPTIPTLTTRAATAIAATTATCGGDISSNGGSAVTACGVCWNTTGTPTLDDGHAGGTVGAGFTASLTGLAPGILYHVRAYAINAVGVAYGGEVTFTTLATLPTVTTAAVSNITVTSADCGGTVTDDGSDAVTARGVCWGTGANPTIAGSHTHDGTGTGTFTSSITGLTACTTYYVRAYATNSQGTAYGAEVVFNSSPTIPTLTTRAATAIAATTATSGGDISSNGGSAVTACGVCWNTTGTPTLDDGHAGGTVGAGFTAALTGLSSHVLYYVRAYAINAVGVAYGNEVSFTTLGITPTVTTAAASSIGVSTADSGGTVTSDGGASVTARGVCWNTSPTPTIADSHTTDGTGTGGFTSNLGSLTQGTFYYVRAYATNSAGTAYGNEVTFTTNDVPIVTTTAVSYIDPDAAISGGEVTCDGGSSVTARGICWGTTANPTIAGSHTHDSTGTGIYASSLTSLTPNTTYHVRAYATNTLGTGYGSDIPFVTAVTAPTVVLTGVSTITSSTATWGGSVTADGGDTVAARGVCWSTSADPTVGGSHTTNGTGTGTFTSSLTGLTFQTTYHVRAYATNGQGTAYSEDVTFVTEAATPTLTTRAATDIMAVSATCGGDVTSDGGSTVAACGVCWNTTGSPTLADSRVAGTVAAGFSVELTGLQPGVFYYARSYAINSAGPAYGGEVTFTTLSSVPTVTTGAVSNIGVYTADCGGTVSSDGGAPITARGVCWGTSASPTLAGAHTSDGTGLGGFTSALSGLAPNAAYHVRAYASNSMVTTYGSELTFTTLGTTPSVTAAAIVAVNITTATGGGTVTADGGVPLTARGVCWSTSANPTIADAKTIDGTGTGTFESTLTGLTPDVLYHLRAYATNSLGTAYSADGTFTIPGDLPALTTTVILAISANRATSGGTVIADGGTPLTGRGVCWSTSPEPTIDDSKTTDGNGIGTFASSITGLRPDTTYHVRAYATNSAGVGYGQDQIFTTTYGTAPFSLPCGSAGALSLTLTLVCLLGVRGRKLGSLTGRR